MNGMLVCGSWLILIVVGWIVGIKTAVWYIENNIEKFIEKLEEAKREAERKGK